MKKFLAIFVILLLVAVGFYLTKKDQYTSGQPSQLKDLVLRATTSADQQTDSSAQTYVPPTTSDTANPYANVKVGDHMGAFIVVSKEPYTVTLSGETTVRGKLVYLWGEYDPQWFCLEVAAEDRAKIPSGKPLFCMKGTIPAENNTEVVVKIRNYQIYAGEKEATDIADFVSLVK
jgi:hypothetical protein